MTNYKVSGMLLVITIILLSCKGSALVPVCSTVGGLCQKTTDCCKGCCEGYSCVDRNFSCNPDLIPIPGGNTCGNQNCAAGELCFLAELEILYSGSKRKVCPPENPCPQQPFCRKVAGSGYNYTKPRGRNEASSLKLKMSAYIPLFIIFNVVLFIVPELSQ